MIVSIPGILSSQRRAEPVSPYTWTRRYSGQGYRIYSGVVYNGVNTYVYCVSGGAGVSDIWKSADGILWEIAQTDKDSMKDLATNGTLWCAVGPTNYMITASGDPSGTWTVRDPGFGASNVNFVYYDGTTWISGGDSGKLATASNPTSTWTSRVSGFSTTNIKGIEYDGSTYWTLVGESGTITTSTNPTSVDFTACVSSGFGTSNISAVAYSPTLSLWCAVGASGKIATASNPTGTWTLRVSSFSASDDLQTIEWDPDEELFVVGSSDGYIGISSSGASWYVTPSVVTYTGITIDKIRYNNGVLYFTGEDGIFGTSNANEAFTFASVASAYTGSTSGQQVAFNPDDNYNIQCTSSESTKEIVVYRWNGASTLTEVEAVNSPETSGGTIWDTTGGFLFNPEVSTGIKVYSWNGVDTLTEVESVADAGSYRLAINSDSSFLCSADAFDPAMKVYSWNGVDTLTEVENLVTANSTNGIHFSPDDQDVIAATNNTAKSVIWYTWNEVDTLTENKTLNLGSVCRDAIWLEPSNNFSVAANGQYLKMIEYTGGSLTVQQTIDFGSGYDAFRIAVFPGSFYIAVALQKVAGGTTNAIRVYRWDGKITLTEVATITHTGQGSTDVEFSNDGSHIAFTTYAETGVTMKIYSTGMPGYTLPVFTQRTSGFGSSEVVGSLYNSDYGWFIYGQAGKIATASDPTGTWTLGTSGFGSEDIRGGGYDGTYYTIVGFTGSMATATDPSGTWTSRTSSFGATRIEDIHYGSDGYWVAVGYDGKLATATDPTGTWTQRTSSYGGADSIRSVARGSDGYWVTVALGGLMATATDPTGTWTQRTSSFGATNIYTIEYGNGYWVATGESGKIAYATNPTGTWTQNTHDPFPTETILGLWYDSVNNIWISVSTSGKMAWATNPAGYWQEITSSFGSDNIIDVHYGVGTGIWLAAGFAGKIATGQ